MLRHPRRLHEPVRRRRAPVRLRQADREVVERAGQVGLAGRDGRVQPATHLQRLLDRSHALVALARLDQEVREVVERAGQVRSLGKTRDLSGIEVDYFFADGSYFRMHPGAPAEPVLMAWGITSAGKPVFLGMEPGSSESHDAWAGFFRGLKARGLRDPLLVISDGGKGLIGATEIVFERTLRQRCLIHRARNILAKVPVHAQAQAPGTGRSLKERRSRADI